MITDISVINSISTLLKLGAVPHFIKLLSSSHNNVCEQAIWALGNIAGDGPKARDLVIQCGVIPAMLSITTPDKPVRIKANKSSKRCLLLFSIYSISVACVITNMPVILGIGIILA